MPLLIPGSEQRNPDGTIRTFDVSGDDNSVNTVAYTPETAPHYAALQAQGGGEDEEPQQSFSMTNGQGEATSPIETTPPPAPAQQTAGPIDAGGAVPVATPAPIPSSSGPQLATLRDTSDTSRTVDPKLQKKADEANMAAMDAIKAQGDAEVAIHQSNALAATAKGVETQRYLDKEAAQRATEDARAQELFKQYQATKDEYKAMSVDSDRVWKNASTGDKIIAGFAIALGAMGQTLTGAKSNAAIDSIERNIDRDIDEQKANIAKKRTDVEESRTMYSDLVRKFGDDHAARLATQQMVFAKLADDAQAKAETMQEGVAKTQAQTAATQFNAKALEKQAELSQSIHTTTIKQEPLRAEKGAPQASVKERADMADREKAYDDLVEVQKELESGNTKSGRIQSFKNTVARQFGLEGDKNAQALEAKMQGELIDRLDAVGGRRMSPDQRATVAASMATYGQNPKVAAEVLKENLRQAAEHILAERSANPGAYADSQSRNLRSGKYGFTEQKSPTEE